MKKTLVLIFLYSSLSFFAQKDRIYSWDEAKLASVDSVFKLDMSGMRLDSLPSELKKFILLQSLDLSKNKLKTLPLWLGSLTELQEIDLSKNKLDQFPIVLCQLMKQKKLLLARNEIKTLPSCIGFLKEIEKIDLWANPIESLPAEVLQLNNLKLVDIRGILFSPSFQKQWSESMPNVKWLWDAPCDCIH